MRLNPKSVANFFLDLAAAHGETLDLLKLQKLVYFAHGWHAGYTGEPMLFSPVQAWRFGPVIPALFHEFLHFGLSPITVPAREYVKRKGKFVDVPVPRDPDMRAFLTEVWEGYGGYTGAKLRDFTHAPHAPWAQTRRRFKGLREVDIPFELIREHYAAAVERSEHH